MFTPLEYSCVGLSEEEAEKRHGKDGIEVRLYAISSSWQLIGKILSEWIWSIFIYPHLIFFFVICE